MPESLSPEQSEIINSDETLWKGSGVEVVMPKEAGIVEEEGYHVQIIPEGKRDVDWRESSIQAVMNEGYYGLAAARIIADSAHSENLWANVHWNSRPDFIAGCNVFGRNPSSPEAWGKPVNMRDQKVSLPPDTHGSTFETFGRISEKYFPSWQKAREEFSPFAGGINEINTESDEYRQESNKWSERTPPWDETLIWANEKFSLVAVNNPHLNGIHLVCHARDEYWSGLGGFKRPWQTEQAHQDSDYRFLQGFMENVAILKACQEILSSQDEIPFFNPEIHYSGNWGSQFGKQEEGGNFDEESYDAAIDSPSYELRKVKKTWQKDLNPPGKTGSGMHGHLYATFNQDELVRLPSLPKTKAPSEWEGIAPMSQEIRDKILALIREELTSMLSSLS